MKPSWRFNATCLLLGSTLAVSRMTAIRGPQALARPLSGIETHIGEWAATEDPPLAASIVESLSATSYLSRTYRRGSHTLNLFVAFYANQRAGETMHSPKYCLPGGGWEMVSQGTAMVGDGNRRVAINNYLLVKPGDRMRMLYWYQGRRRVIASEYLGKLYLMWDAFRYGQTSGSIVRVVSADQPELLPEGLSFSSEMIRQVAHCFGE